MHSDFYFEEERAHGEIKVSIDEEPARFCQACARARYKILSKYRILQFPEVSEFRRMIRIVLFCQA